MGWIGALAIAAVIAVAFLYATNPGLLGFGNGRSADVVLPAGTTQSLCVCYPNSFHEFQTHRAGTLQGSFSIRGNDNASVFVSNASGYSSATLYGPSGFAYNSGWGRGGELSVQLSTAEIYWVGGWPEPGNFTNYYPLHVTLTWTSDLVFEW